MLALPALAETLRIATWHVELERDGPGLLLRDILKGEDPAIDAAVDIIAHVAPDILLLSGIDWDLQLAALGALADRIAGAGPTYPHLFATRPNAGMATGLDMDGDGRTGDPRDAQGYGRFSGHGGLALLSRFPIDRDAVRDFSGLLWVDMPGNLLRGSEDDLFDTPQAARAQRLSSVAHWDVPVLIPRGRLHLLAFAAGPPVFDGPEDRNGKRNHDEVAVWSRYLSGALARAPPDAPVIVIGHANLDPADGEGRRDAIHALLADPRLRDTRPASRGGVEALAQGGVNTAQTGDPALDSADWPDADGPGNLRVDYVLPDRRLSVRGSGVFWPAADDPQRPLIEVEGGSRYRMVWVDVALPP